MPTGVWMPVSCIIDARADRLRPAVDVADDLHRLVHLGDELVLRHARRATGTCGFSMTVVSIISTGAGSVAVSARPSLPKTRSTSGKRLQLPVHLLEDPARLPRRQPRQRRRHVEDRALLHLRHVVLLETAASARRPTSEQRRADADERVAVANRPRQRRRDSRARTRLSRSLGGVPAPCLKTQTMTTGSRNSVSSVENAIANVLLKASGLNSRAFALAEEEDRQERRHDDQHREQQRPASSSRSRG